VQIAIQACSQQSIENSSHTSVTHGVQSCGGFALEAAHASKVHGADVVLVVLSVAVVLVVVPLLEVEVEVDVVTVVVLAVPPPVPGSPLEKASPHPAVGAASAPAAAATVIHVPAGLARPGALRGARRATGRVGTFIP
jgi:hypothetical protein